MKYTYSIVIIAVAGLAFLAATSAPSPLIAKGAPEIDIQAVNYDTTALFEAYATSRDMLSFSVRVVGPDNYLFEQRSELTSSIDWQPETLVDGWYYWEAWVVTAERGAPMRTLPDDTSSNIAIEHLYERQYQQAHVKSGAFEVSNGLLDDSGIETETEEDSYVRRVAAAILEFFMPSAQAAGWEWDHFSVLDGDDDNDVFLQLHVDDNGNPDNWYLRNWHGNLLFQHGSNSSKQTAMQVDQGGRVGIFTGAPNARLHVASPAGQMPFMIHGGNTGTTEFAVTPYGHVGIGVGPAPLARLHLDDKQSGDAPLWISSGGILNNTWFKIGKSGKTGVGTKDANTRLHVVSNHNENPFRIEIRDRESERPFTHFFINYKGYTGIGTDSPAHRLDVKGGAVADDFLHVRNPSGTGSTRLNLNADNSNSSNVDTWRLMNNASAGKRFELREGGATRFAILKGGNAGFGTTAPAAPIHVQRADSTARVRIQDSGATGAQTMLWMIANGHPRARFDDSSQADVRWQIGTSGVEGSDESFIITKVGSGSAQARLFHTGDLEISGTLSQGSSRTIKEQITEMNADTVLTKLEALPVHEWSYRNMPRSRHAGPMAEDFFAVFNLGHSDKHIAPGDMAGVALAAAKALNEKLNAENAELRERHAMLEERLQRLEALIPEHH